MRWILLIITVFYVARRAVFLLTRILTISITEVVSDLPIGGLYMLIVLSLTFHIFMVVYEMIIEKSVAYYSLVQADSRVLTAISLVQVVSASKLICLLLYMQQLAFFPIYGGPSADVIVLWMTFSVRLTVDASCGSREDCQALDFPCLTSNYKYSTWMKATKLDAFVYFDIWMELSFTQAGYFTTCIALPQYEANVIVHTLIFQQITLPDFSEHGQSGNFNDPTVLERTSMSGLCKDLYSSKDSNKYIGGAMVCPLFREGLHLQYGIFFFSMAGLGYRVFIT